MWWAAAIVATSVALSPGQERPADLVRDVPDLLVRGLYEQAEAAARKQVDDARSRHADGAVEIATASDDLVRALLANGRGAAASTLILARETFALKEARLGGAHPGLVPSLLNFGDALVAAFEFQQAIGVLQRAVALQQRSAGPEHHDVAPALDHLGAALGAAGQLEDALKVLEQSLRLKDAAAEKQNVSIARTLEELAFVQQGRAAYSDSASALRRAAAVREAAGRDHPEYARTLNLLAQQAWYEGNLTASRRFSEEAVGVAERTLRPDHPTIAFSLRLLAGTLADLGDLRQSLALKERALTMVERNVGRSHPAAAEYLYTLGVAEFDQGDYAVARTHLQAGLSVFEARYGPSHEFVATALSTLALADARLGDYGSARRNHSRAVAIFSRAGGPSHPYVALALTEFAVVFRDQGLPGEARPLFERALAIREQALGGSHRTVGTTLAELAATLMQLGQRDRARIAAERAVTIWENVNAPDAPEFASVLRVYATIQSRRGDVGAARELYSRALAIQEKSLSRSHPSFAETQAGFAVALATLGESGAALDAAMGAETTGREHLRLMLRYLPERHALNYAAVRPRGIDLTLSLVGRTPEAAAAGLDVAIRARALVLDEMAARRSDAQSSDESTKQLRAELGTARQRLANLLVRGPANLDAGRYTALVDETRLEAERLELRLAEQSADFRRELTRERLGIDDVASSIPDGAALVSFVRYNRTAFPVRPPAPAPAVTRATSTPVASYIAFVVRPHQAPVAVALGPAAAIDTVVSRWRQDIASEGASAVGPPANTTAGAATAPASRQSGAALRKLVWDPLAPHLREARQIFIVPDGALSLVPFVALPAGRAEYLIEQAPPIHYLSTERDLVTARSEAAATTQGLLALGGPSFNAGGPRPGTNASGAKSTIAKNTAPVRSAATGCAGLNTINFEPLAGTLQEVKEIAALWHSRYPVSQPDAARLLTGAGASERAFKEQAPGHRVLHLATHGFFLDNGCVQAAGGSRGVGGVTTARSSAPRRTENPLLLSGLALAGANRRQSAAADEDDGILTAGEVATLNLEGVEWAVLSACDTGVGQITDGEGVFGLRRAFQIAGARTVIMSLWSVDDQAARTWMRALYEARLQKQVTTADAVHAANLSMLRTRRTRGLSTHPFFWAAFVAVGDWR